MISIVHFTCAKVLEIPELELSEDESTRLAESVRKVAKHYSVNIDPKKLAVVELIFCAGSIYGPRAISYFKRTSPRKAVGRPVAAAPAPAAAASTSSGANGIPPIPTERVPHGAVPSDMWQEDIVDGSFI